MERAAFDILDEDAAGKTNSKKMMKIMLGTVLPEELKLEIVKRLPVKKLYRCMCLSKAWYSTLRNPLFINPHFKAYYSLHQHCGGLLVSLSGRKHPIGCPLFEPKSVYLDAYYSPLLPEEEDSISKSVRPTKQPSVRVFSVDSSPSYCGVTNVVNGLFCFYQGNRAMVCNVYTRETMLLPDAPTVAAAAAADDNDDCPSFSDVYYFGYDPVNGLYKLLRISASKIQVQAMFGGRFSVRKHAHILTLGGGRVGPCWKEVHIGFNEPSRFPVQSFLFNGVLYWVMDWKAAEQRRGLLCFDLNTEKFDFIRSRQEEPFLTRSFYGWSVAQFKGRLALLIPDSDSDPDCLVIYTLDDYERGGVGASSWTRHAIPFPPGFFGAEGSPSSNIFPVGNLPPGQILFINTPMYSSSFTTVYSYDHHNNKFQKFVVCKLPIWTTFSSNFPRSMSYVLEKNNVPLDVLFGTRKDEACVV